MKPPLLMRLYSQIARRTRILSGLTPLAFNCVTNRCFGSRNYSVHAHTHAGLDIEVDVNDYDGRILYLFGTNDPKVQALASELLAPGDTFLDIGANYSSIGLYASRKVGAAGSVHLFEPQSYIADRVHAAITLGDMSNVVMHKVALLDHDATMTMKVPVNHSGMATLVEHSNHSWKSLTVQVRDIGNYVGPLVRGKRFGVKLDVEGAEPRLVPWLVAQKNFKFMIFEAALNQEILFDQMTRAGLTIFGLRRNIFQKQVEHVAEASSLQRFHDLVAVHIDEPPPSIISMNGLAKLTNRTNSV